MKRLLNFAVFLLPVILPLYVIRFNLGPLPTTFLELFILIFVGLWLLARRADGIRQMWVTLNAWRWPVVAWLAATLFAVAIAPDHWAAFGHWRAFMLEPILVFAVLLDLFKTSPIRPSLTKSLLGGIAAVTVAMGVYAVIQYFTGWGIPSPWDEATMRRATGVFGYPNGLALFMAPFGVACFIEWLSRLWDDERATRLFYLFGAAAAAASVLLAKSMGGILAFGLGVALALVIKKQTRKIGLAACAMGLVGSLVAGAMIYRTQITPQNIGDTVATSKRWSSMVRTVIWKESWQLAASHPLLGTGLRSYPTAILPFHTATWMEVFPHPHNILLMLWIETGLLGLIAFAWICWTWVVTVRSRSTDGRDSSPLRLRTATDNLPWVVPLIVILVHGMVDMPYFKNDLAVQFWLLASLATAFSVTYHAQIKPDAIKNV